MPKLLLLGEFNYPPLRDARVLHANTSFSSLLEASRLELAAEESFTSLVLDIKGRKRAQRTELVQNLSEDSAPVEPKKKKNARKKSKKKKKNR